MLKNIGLAINEAASMRMEEKDGVVLAEKKRVVDGKYASIISSVCIKYQLYDSSFITDTILSRLKNRDPSGMKNQNKSPLVGIEPKIVKWCQLLSDMGEALTKYELMALPDDIIRDIFYEKPGRSTDKNLEKLKQTMQQMSQ